MTGLTTSHWIPDGSGPPLLDDVTVGSRLREVAGEVPDRVALVEGLPIPDRRQWTYAELLADAERCARWLLQSLRAGRTHRGVGAQPARMGDPRVWCCAGRIDSRDRQPKSAAGRGELHPRAVAIGGVVPCSRRSVATR